MRSTVRSYLEKLSLDRARQRKVISILLALSILVSTGVFWQLRLVGIALTGDPVYCGIEDHEHTLACHSDRTADVETQEEWSAALKDWAPSGNWSEDIVAVAQSQLGYSESEKNFEVAEDGVTLQGYTRYGEWAKDPYGDWNELFAAFTLAYAQVPADSAPVAYDSYPWTVALDEKGLYRPAQTYTPQAGDLMFFDITEDGKADRLAIVTSVEPVAEESSEKTGATQSLMVHAMEGDKNNVVAATAYDSTDKRLVGYGSITAAYEAHLAATTNEVTIEDSAAPESDQATLSPEPEVPANLDSDSQPPATDTAAPAEGTPEPAAPAEVTPEPVAEPTPGESAPSTSVEPKTDSGIEGETPLGEEPVTEPSNGLEGELFAQAQFNELTVEATRVESNLYLSELKVTYGNEAMIPQAGSYWLEYSDDNGLNWSPASPAVDSALPGSVVLSASRDRIDGSWTHIKRSFRVAGMAAEQSVSSPAFDLLQIMEQSKPGFSAWLESSLVQDFDGTAPSETKNLFQAFDLYTSLIPVTLVQETAPGAITLSALTDAPQDYHYEWQYKNAADQWGVLSAECASQIQLTASALTESGKVDVRVKLSLADGVLGISTPLTVDTTVLSENDQLPEETTVPLPGSEVILPEQPDPALKPEAGLETPLTETPAAPETQPIVSEPSKIVSLAEQQLGVQPESLLIPGDVQLLNVQSTISASFNNLAITALRTGTNPYFDSLTVVFTSPTVLVNKKFFLRYSDDGGTTWVLGSAEATSLAGKVTVTALPAAINSSWTKHQRLFRVDNTRDSVFSAPFTLTDILNGSRAGFAGWLGYGYIEFFQGTPPQNVANVFSAYDKYVTLPGVTVNQTVTGTVIQLQCLVDPPGSYTYLWEYKTAGGQWAELQNSTSSTLTLTGAIANTLKDGKEVRCRVYENGTFKNTSTPQVVEPRQAEYDQKIPEINTKLGLSQYGPAGANLTIDGYQFKNLFYYGNVARDPAAPFKDAASYKNYLAKVYIDQGEAAARLVWERYFYDLYDPTVDLGNSNGGSGGTGFPYPGTYGDKTFTWPKDAGGVDSTSFHTNDPYLDTFPGTKNITPRVLPLNFSYLEKGVDYSNFVSKLTKSAQGISPGDANLDRLYDIGITADAQAKIKAPVALIFQIQTSWQMFDLAHANKLVDPAVPDGTNLGAASNNTALANLYDIKKALLRLVDYMDVKYPGNNLVMGITEVRHGGSSSMFQGLDGANKPLYVTNDSAALRGGLIGWDSFGNCEHVHYDSDTLEDALLNLASNLNGWKNVYGTALTYDQIQKVGVIIGGPTENSTGTSGYGITLPWTVFQTAKLNSVYGIRTNEGTPLNAAGLISWIDYSGNTAGTPFKDGTGTAFTQRFVASNEDRLFQTLVNIVEKEMLVKSMDVVNPTNPAPDQIIPLIDNLTVEDVVADEFQLNWDKPIKATIYQKDGVTVVPVSTTIPYPERYFSQADAVVTMGPAGERITTVAARTRDGTLAGVEKLVVTEAYDATTKTFTTTTLSFNFGKVENTRKAILSFQVKAKANYLGSNNVYTNVGVPSADYDHQPLDQNGQPTGTVAEYSAPSFDTPQVNVPIRYGTVNGDKITIFTGDTIDLKNLSNAIVADAEYRATLYNQIDGTLKYQWTMPDGTVKPLSSVVISGGNLMGSFPERSQAYTGTTPGSYQGTLTVTFTPLPTNDPARQAVSLLTKTGKVWIDVITDSTLLKRYVEKQWPGGAGAHTNIEFLLLANGEPVTNSDGSAKVYTLSKDDNWKRLIQDLPASRMENGQKVILNYTVEELNIPSGYGVSYDQTIQTDPTYAATATLIMTTTDDIPAGDQIAISYRYGGIDYTFKPPLFKYLKTTPYTFTIPNLPLDANGAPYPISITGYTVKGTTSTKISATATVAKVQSGTVDIPVLVIRNTPSIVLPQTGGPGTMAYTYGGLLLMAGALLYGNRSKRRRQRRR